MDAKLASAIWGRAYAADPPKSFTLLGFKRFWESGVGKKDAKIPRCVSEVILDTSWRCFTVFLLLAKRENTVISNVFVLLA